MEENRLSLQRENEQMRSSLSEMERQISMMGNQMAVNDSQTRQNVHNNSYNQWGNATLDELERMDKDTKPHQTSIILQQTMLTDQAIKDATNNSQHVQDDNQ